MLDLSKLYKIPWTKDNNPTGWIEVTTHCQLKCPGCYRACDQGIFKEHEDLEKIKKDIDRFIKERNIQYISIAGGEPLLYPHLKEVVAYAKSKGIGNYIITNGVLLTKELIKEYQQLGDSKFVVHIEKSQGYKDVNKRRREVCKMFREIKETRFGFIMSVCSENYDDMLDLIEVSKQNSDLIQCLTLAIYQDISYGDKNKQMTRPVPEEVIDIVCKEFKSKPCAYLGKIISKDKPSWLYIDPVFRDNKVIRYFSPAEYKEYWDKMYQEDKLKLLNYNVLDDGSNLMTVHILVTPQKVNGKYDLCVGCPDAMYYKGKLVPSCLLERIKEGEEIEII